MLRPCSLALAGQLLLGLFVSAQAQEAPPTVGKPAGESVSADPARTGATGTGATARPAPPRQARPTPPPATSRLKRQPRPYKVCLQRARERRLRGGDRRSFLVRCQLGYAPRRPAPVRQ